MHYLLGDQHYYFPSSDEQSFSLQEFFDSKYCHEYQLPTVVRITAVDIPTKTTKHILRKNTPLLLLELYDFISILAEYHPLNDGRHLSSKSRPGSTQAKVNSKAMKLYATKKLSTSLVTLTKTTSTDDNSDDEYENMRIILRNLNKQRLSSTLFCRIPTNYHGCFELLNQNDQAIEPVHELSSLSICEVRHENNQEIRTTIWPPTFFLRSTCVAYTKRHIPDDRPLSGSGDSCYGSLSDLESQRNLLILNDERIVLQPGQIITILDQCSAYRSQRSEKEPSTTQFVSQSSSSWFGSKSRFFFLRKHISPINAHNRPIAHKSPIKNIYDVSKRPEPYLKCKTERGDIVYISINATGLFSPINSSNNQTDSLIDTEDLDISGVFQLQDLISTFRFPLSVHLLNNTMSFDNIYAPANVNRRESSSLTLTKLRLLLPYMERVIFACPLVLPSSFKSETIVIPIPINSNIEVQRCLNIREITMKENFQNLLCMCQHIIDRYKSDLSYVLFPIILNSASKQALKRKHPLYKKRSQSESHLEFCSTDIVNSKYQKSCEAFNYDPGSDLEHSSIIETAPEKIYHRDSFETARNKLSSNPNDDNNQRQQTSRRSGNYTKLKTERLRKYSRQQEHDSEDENYRDLDHIYDYIRSGDVTDDVQRIQAKEQALNAAYNAKDDSVQLSNSKDSIPASPRTQRSEKRTKTSETYSKIKKNHRSSHDLDDSRPIGNEFEQCRATSPRFKSRRNPPHAFPEPTTSQPIIKSTRYKKQ